MRYKFYKVLLTDITESRDAIASKNLKLLPQTSQTELIPVVKFVEKDLRSVEVRIILLSVNFLLKGVFFSVNDKQNTWFFNSCFIAE